jgi:hypothetical protein
MTGQAQILGGTTLQLHDPDGASGVSITFQRTLRIPDNGKTYPLPPGLGAFPLRRVRDYASRVPADWVQHGGVFLPMYQREAMWLSFSGAPHALKIGIGKVCAITGEPWRHELARAPQNYVVTGTQPWLDGIASGKGTIRQFVAMPLGQGYTVEGQLTGEERFGGIQLQSFAPKPGRIPSGRFDDLECCAPSAAAAAPQSVSRSRGAAMGLAAGGRMKQKIYPDPYGLDVWDPYARARVYVHIVNSAMWREITGEAAPPTPVNAKSYTSAGLPWFELYDEHAATVDPTAALAGVKSIKELDEEPMATPNVKKLWWKHHGTVAVDDGDW